MWGQKNKGVIYLLSLKSLQAVKYLTAFFRVNVIFINKKC